MQRYSKSRKCTPKSAKIESLTVLPFGEDENLTSLWECKLAQIFWGIIHNCQSSQRCTYTMY